MDNTNTTTTPTPHISLQDAAALLRSYGWTPGQITAITTQTELDWIESRQRAYRLADATDARAARLAAQAAQPIGSSGTAERVKRPKRTRAKKVSGDGGLFNEATQ